MKLRKWPVVGLVMAVLWLFVRGVELADTPVVHEALLPVLGEFIIGIAVGFPIAYLFRRMYLPEVDVTRSLRAVPMVIYYVSLFLYELLTANVDVAYRVLAPSMPIEPDVVEVPLRVETDAAITSIANSITLTPGTLTMDHDPETNTLYVHGIVGRRRKQVIDPIRRWEDLLLVIFDEEADPEDDPPDPPSSRAPKAAEHGANLDETDETGGDDGGE